MWTLGCAVCTRLDGHRARACILEPLASRASRAGAPRPLRPGSAGPARRPRALSRRPLRPFLFWLLFYCSRCDPARAPSAPLVSSALLLRKAARRPRRAPRTQRPVRLSCVRPAEAVPRPVPGRRRGPPGPLARACARDGPLFPAFDFARRPRAIARGLSSSHVHFQCNAHRMPARRPRAVSWAYAFGILWHRSPPPDALCAVWAS